MLRPVLLLLLLALCIGVGIKAFEQIPPHERARVGRAILFGSSCIIAAGVVILFLKAMF